MNKTLIIYKSSTGFAKKYAEWLRDELQCDLVSFDDRDTVLLSDYDVVIYGGGLYAGTINGIDWLKRRLPELTEKTVAVFATGAMPADAKQNGDCLRKNFTNEEWEQIKVFFLHSGLNYEKMSFKHRVMMKMFCKILKKKDPEAYEVIRHSFDHTSKETLEPLIQFINDCRS